MPRSLAVMLLLLCTLLWGFAFVVQKSAMEVMGPLTFTGIRYLLGGIAILPIALLERRRHKQGFSRPQATLIAIMTLALLTGTVMQQYGLLTTTVTNGGFLTALYVLFVPLIAYVMFRSLPHPVIFVGVPLALVGIYYLNGGGLDRFNGGDYLIVGSAVIWALQVVLLGFLARTTAQPMLLSFLSFVGVGTVAFIAAFVLETPSLSGILAGWSEIAYAGIVSTAIAFSLQAVGQQHVPASNAAIVLSSESLFAAVGGAVFLGERLPMIGYAGALLIFAAIILVEAVPAFIARRQVEQPPEIIHP